MSLIPQSSGEQEPTKAEEPLAQDSEDYFDRIKPIDQREDRFLSENEIRQKDSVIRAKSRKVSSDELGGFLRSRAHSVSEAALTNKKLTAEQILDFAENRVDLEKWGGGGTHEWRCLILILHHPNTPESVLKRIASFSGTFNEAIQKVFSHPNCPVSLLRDHMTSDICLIRPSIARSPHLTETLAIELVKDVVARRDLENWTSRFGSVLEGESAGENPASARLVAHISEQDRESLLNLAANDKVPLEVLRRIEPGSDAELISGLAARFDGPERESLLARLETVAPDKKETLLTIAKLSRNPSKLSELSLVKNKEVLRAVATNACTPEEDKVMIALILG